MGENKFTKEQLKNSNTFNEYKDVLGTFLKDDKSYTIEEAQEVINNFLNKEGK